MHGSSIQLIIRTKTNHITSFMLRDPGGVGWCILSTRWLSSHAAGRQRGSPLQVVASLGILENDVQMRAPRCTETARTFKTDVPNMLDPAAFVAKWRANTRNERAAAQEHFLDLCALLEEPTPNSDPTGATYAFEKGATKASGGDGWADVWRRGRFAWEYQGKHKDLEAAHRQLLQYAGALENPPLLVISDIERVSIRTNWTNTVSERHEVRLEDITDPSHLSMLKAVFADPDRLRPDKSRAARHSPQKPPQSLQSFQNNCAAVVMTRMLWRISLTGWCFVFLPTMWASFRRTCLSACSTQPVRLRRDLKIMCSASSVRWLTEAAKSILLQFHGSTGDCSRIHRPYRLSWMTSPFCKG